MQHDRAYLGLAQQRSGRHFDGSQLVRDGAPTPGGILNVHVEVSARQQRRRADICGKYRGREMLMAPTGRICRPGAVASASFPRLSRQLSGWHRMATERFTARCVAHKVVHPLVYTSYDLA